MSKRISLMLTLAAFFGIHQQAESAAFALIEQSVSSMGNAYAGGAAIAEDATTIFFNPAGLTRLSGRQIVVGAHGVLPSAEFHDEGSILFPLVAGGPVLPDNYTLPTTRLKGNNGGDAGMNAVVGHLYFSKQLNNNWWAGLGINSPFGLETSYKDHWKGRYHALHSALLTVDINPVVAYKFNNCWSIGGGFRALYAHAKLTNSVDYGTIAWLSSLMLPTLDQIEATQTALNGIGFLPQTEDGHAFVKGNAWAFGGNLGVLYEPWCGTRFGFNWRSQVKIHVKGKERFDRLPDLIRDPSLAGPLESFFAAIKAAAATDTRARSRITLPDILQISAYHDLNSCWAIMGDITWTRWSVLKHLVFKFNNPNQANVITTLEWRNAFRYSIGANYSPNCRWKLRTGIAYDETPIRYKKDRTPRIPDQSRFWTAFGAGYDWNSCWHVDAAYAHLFVRKPKIDKSRFTLPEDFVRGGLKGKWDAGVNIVSVQAVYNF